MYTIILLRTRNTVSFTRYQFAFLNLKIKGELELCFWEPGYGETYEHTLRPVIRELNTKINDHSEWKLVIYDEKCKNGELDGPMKSLVRLFSGKHPDPEDLKVEGSFPVQILYVQSCEKEYIPLTDNTDLCYVDEERELGGNFRMFRFELESGNSRVESYSGFKLYCALLSLALGQIPYAFMEAGYLYQLDIEIDRKLFAEYVLALDDRLSQIKEWQEKEREELKNRSRMVSPFPDMERPDIKIEDGQMGMKEDRKGRILTFCETLKAKDIDFILKQNRDLLDVQMFYPKGVLHEEKEKIHKLVQELKSTKNFLDEAGKELLDRKTQEVIAEICEKKEVQLEQQKFQEEIHEAEERIKSQSVRMIKGKQRWLVLTVFGIIELFVVEPFAYHFAISQEEYGSSFTAVICLLAGAATFALVYGGYYVYLYYRHRKSWGFYKKKIFDGLSVYRKEKKKYLEEMMSLLLQFQYLEKIRTEQKQLSYQCSLDYNTLNHHFQMLEDGFANLRHLSHLLDGEEQEEHMCEEALRIDFTREPKEEDYYRIPFQKENYWLEVNYSGYKTQAAFGFITRLMIKKAICNKEGRNHKNE